MYSIADSAKYLAGGTSEIPSWMTDAIIKEWISDSDAYIDQGTEKSEGGWASGTYSTTALDSGVPRRITRASKLLVAAQILKAKNGKASAGVAYKVKEVSVDRKGKQQTELAMANSYIKQADTIIAEELSNTIVEADITLNGVC